MTAAGKLEAKASPGLQRKCDGVVNSVTAVDSAMIERGRGHLAVISSLAAYRGAAQNRPPMFQQSCHFVSVRKSAARFAATGIDVTIIHPGFIKTP